MPEDAAGRVELIVMRPPADVLEKAEQTAPAAATHRVARMAAQLMSYDGWMATGVLAVVLVAIFVIGLWSTH